MYEQRNLTSVEQTCLNRTTRNRSVTVTVASGGPAGGTGVGSERQHAIAPTTPRRPASHAIVYGLLFTRWITTVKQASTMDAAPCSAVCRATGQSSAVQDRPRSLLAPALAVPYGEDHSLVSSETSAW